MAINVLFDNLMPARPAWNRLDSSVPPWFVRRLARFDPGLVLQYFPPADPVASGAGVDRRMFPRGVWAVCRRLRKSGMLLKRWVMCLTDSETGDLHVTPRVFGLLRRARSAWRRDHDNRRLERELDRSIARLRHTESQESRRALAENVAGTCRRLSITKRSLGVPRFFMRPGATV